MPFFCDYSCKVEHPLKIIVLIGPTAVGKTRLSLAIAEQFLCEIVNMDSMQIYRYMDIGTAKPTETERARVPHHLIDFIDPAEDYHVARYVDDANRVMDAISGENRLPMLVGGTGLYLKGLVEGLFEIPPIAAEIREQVRLDLHDRGNQEIYLELQQIDPETAARIHPNDSRRISRAIEIYRATGVAWSVHLKNQKEQAEREGSDLDILKIGLTREREILYERINERTRIMIEQGLVEEVENLLAMGYGAELNSMQSIGYRHMVNYIQGRWGRDEAIQLLARDTRRYAKRQYTWFRRDKDICWFEPEQQSEIFTLIKQFLRS
ncbi:TPA: tRNA (adenosine(37)-N6)-dimethylallyltransferase MiaA [Candidatus Bipolaricaulota bacterium]|nr:tRNA (adenosine(37)-N6)-dimethylallyltransferase MiaA [Candidatus Bipolaricaulota bacterium]